MPVAEWQESGCVIAVKITPSMPNGQVANSIAALDANVRGDLLFQFSNGVNSMVVRRATASPSRARQSCHLFHAWAEKRKKCLHEKGSMVRIDANQEGGPSPKGQNGNSGPEYRSDIDLVRVLASGSERGELDREVAGGEPARATVAYHGLRCGPWPSSLVRRIEFAGVLREYVRASCGHVGLGRFELDCEVARHEAACQSLCGHGVRFRP